MCFISRSIYTMALKLLFIVSFAFTSVFSFPAVLNEGCSININSDLTAKHPLILYVNKNEFILPNAKKGINFNKGETIRLVCPGQNNHLAINNKLKEVTVTCIGDKTFTVNDKIHINKTFKELGCFVHPEATAQRSDKKCSNIFTEIDIGFPTKKGFLSIITNCFDDIKKDTLYSKYQLTSKIKTTQYNVPRPRDFKEGDFYEDIYPKPRTLYTRRNQRIAFEKLLGSAELAKKYISLNSDYFLSRGHLTAKADFVYGSQQLATFFYVNVAPQWQTFNEQNWQEIEKGCRNFAKNRNLDLTVYTGVYGQAKLPDVNNIEQNLSLFINKNGKQAITVPEIYWKILHEPISNKGIVFVGHNNPYDTNVASKTICNDISNQIPWVTWEGKNVSAGFSYSCDFTDFKQVIDYIPDIPIQGLLV